MTAKVDSKKIAIILAAVVALILGVILLFGGKDTQTSAPALSTNEGRVKFLTDFGWDVVVSPTQTSQVKIPAESGDVFERYNALQKSQGYDLSQYAGKTVMRYVYKVNNFPGATEPVYATVLVYKNQIIGGDITDTGAKGVVQGFKKQEATQPTETQAATVPETT
jgi:hypothetical protein